MLKRTLKNILQETTDKLNLTLLENRQLRERLEVFESENSEEKINELNEKINQLVQENEDIRNNYESKFQEYESELKELEERNNALTIELNKLKGEHFDTQRYADDLKARLDSITPREEAKEEISIPTPPPTPKVITAEEKDEESFKYGSQIISEAVINTATVTSRLSTSSDPNAAELKALAMGKCEMLKAEVLQTVMSDMIPETKTSRMDNLLKELADYLDGILGQLTQ